MARRVPRQRAAMSLDVSRAVMSRGSPVPVLALRFRDALVDIGEEIADLELTQFWDLVTPLRNGRAAKWTIIVVRLEQFGDRRSGTENEQ